MSRKIKQIIWDDGALNKELLKENDRVIALGIQAAPGTKFMINNGSAIEMGMFCIYELDLERLGGLVNSIKIVAKSTSKGASSRVIIDVVYEDGGAVQ